MPRDADRPYIWIESMHKVISRSRRRPSFGSLDRMRTLTVIIIVLIAQCATAAPEISARVSKPDIAEISSIVRAATREPLLSIDPVYESKPVAHAIRRSTVEARIERGKVVNIPVFTYERTDRVSVTTGDRRNLTGGGFLLQRAGTKWRIVREGGWIH